jgi:VanZ family protein
MKMSRKQRNSLIPDINQNSLDYDNIFGRLTSEERAFISRLIERDPLRGLYNMSLLVYLLVSILFLLWPFDLSLPKRNNVRWLGTSNGIEFLQEGQVISRSPIERLCGRLLMGTGFTLEVWAAANSPDQTGPARIVSYSSDPGTRNFTLGQSNKKLIMRLRTTQTDLNGVRPHVEVEDVFGFVGPQHIVVAYDFSGQSIFVNGEIRLRRKIPGGTFANWNPSYHLVLGNEATGGRAWNGKIFYVAIYDRALSKQEIHKSYLAGSIQGGLSSEDDSLVSNGLIARYLFEERKGDKVGNDSKTSTPLDLYIPKNIHTHENAYLSLNIRQSLKNPSFLGDMALNILVFIPLGFLFHAALRSRYGSSLKTCVFVFFVGTLFTFGIESLQYFSVTRNSSFIDVTNNILGVTIGICADRFYEAYLKRQVKFLLIKTRRL